ncbi:MAG: hypothetical protein AMXMBFR75_32450 [Candidatus Hinthialibacteria bacterium]
MRTDLLFDELPENEADNPSDPLHDLITLCRMVLSLDDPAIKNDVLAAVTDYLTEKEKGSNKPGPITTKRLMCQVARIKPALEEKNQAIEASIGYLVLCMKRREAGRLGGERSLEQNRNDDGTYRANIRPKPRAKVRPKPRAVGEGRKGEEEEIQGANFAPETAGLDAPLPETKPPIRAVADANASAPQVIKRLPQEKPDARELREGAQGSQSPPKDYATLAKPDTQPESGSYGPKNGISRNKKSAPEGTREVIAAWVEAHKAVYGVPPTDGLKAGSERGGAINLARDFARDDARDFGRVAREKLAPAMRRYLEAKKRKGAKGSLHWFSRDIAAYLDGADQLDAPQVPKTGPAFKSLEEIRAERQKNRQEQSGDTGSRNAGGEA